jgi:hypothetical protein
MLLNKVVRNQCSFLASHESWLKKLNGLISSNPQVKAFRMLNVAVRISLVWACLALIMLWPTLGYTLPNERSDLPLQVGTLSWNQSRKIFEGEMLVELPKVSGEFELALYPNRYIASLGFDSREMMEMYSEGFEGEDLGFLKKYGSLVIRDSLLESFEGPCGVQMRAPLLKVTEQKKVSLKYNTKETLAYINVSEVPAGKCQALRLKFTFSPPMFKGNYGIKNDDEMHFSGPIFPLPTQNVYRTEVKFKNTKAFCSTCLDKEDGSLYVSEGLPAPLHFYSEIPQVSYYSLSGVRFGIVGRGDNEGILSIIRTYLTAFPGIGNLKYSQSLPPLLIFKDFLSKNIVMRHPRELQLGKTFLNAPPLMNNYHGAAFLRALLNELTLHQVEELQRPLKMKNLVELTSLSRLVVEMQVNNWVKNINQFRELTRELRFIPFFDAIFQGKGLVNNAVLLGQEERPNPLDTSPYDALFPAFMGDELLVRTKWCLPPQVVESLQSDVEKNFLNGDSLPNLFTKILNIENKRCESLWKSYFSGRSVNEEIDVRGKVVEGKVEYIEFSRKPRRNPLEILFRGVNDRPYFDFLELVVMKDEKESQRLPWLKGNNIIRVQAGALPQEMEAKIEGPRTDWESDKHIYPRQIQFQISSLKVRFDSQEKAPSGQAGIQWLLRGDQYERAFLTSLKKEQSQYLVEATITGKIQLGRSEEAIEQDGIAPLVYSPWVAPLSLGVRVEPLKGVPDLWMIAATGLGAVDGSLLAPSGLDVAILLGKSIIRPKTKPSAYMVELSNSIFLPVARLTTLITRLKVGKASEGMALGASSGVPGVSPIVFQAENYATSRLELASALLPNLNQSFTGALLLQHIVGYMAHNSAFGLSADPSMSFAPQSVHSLQTGIRFVGAFFGSPDQIVSIDLARGFERKPRNVFSFSIGRN